MMHLNDFPSDDPQFDQRVRAALESLPGASVPDAAFPMEARGIDRLCRRVLCIGGTASVAERQRRLSAAFPNGTDAPLTDYVAASERYADG